MNLMSNASFWKFKHLPKQDPKYRGDGGRKEKLEQKYTSRFSNGSSVRSFPFYFVCYGSY